MKLSLQFDKRLINWGDAELFGIFECNFIPQVEK